MCKKLLILYIILVAIFIDIEGKALQSKEISENKNKENTNDTKFVFRSEVDGNKNLSTILNASINIKENRKNESTLKINGTAKTTSLIVSNSNDPIVSPTSTDGSSDGAKEVVVTNKNLHETEAIRKEIHHAVEDNSYVVQSARDENKTSAVNSTGPSTSDKNTNKTTSPLVKDGPIVSPTSTDGSSDGAKEVVVTNKNLHETEAIRKEIHDAVEENTYVVQSARDQNKTSAVNSTRPSTPDKNTNKTTNPLVKDGPIVSPTSTDGSSDGAKEVVVTNKNLHETEAIRKEILHAVEDNSYVVQSARDENKTSAVISTGPSTSDKNTNKTTSPLVKDGPIVSPTSTDGSSDGAKEVVVTNKNLHETEAIRKEIHHAVEDNSYVVQSARDENKTSAVNSTGPSTSDKNTNKTTSPLVKDGPIVSPTSTDGSSDGAKEVVVTRKNLHETAVIREEIHKAIENDQYVVGVPSELVDIADNFLGLNYRMKNFYSNLTGSTFVKEFEENEDLVGFDLMESKHLDYESKNVNISLIDSTGGIIANVVESQFTNTENKYHFTNLLPKRSPNREVLTLLSIEEDINFSFGYDINEWRVIKTEDYNFLVGIQDFSISIAVKDNFANATKLDFSLPIGCVETFTKWNSTSGKSEGFIIVTIQNMLFLIEANTFRIFWKINIGKVITSIRYYCVDNDDFLAILTSNTKISHPSVKIYKFKLTTQEIWLKQNIPLVHTCSEIVVLHTGRDIVLAVPQQNFTKIFSYNPDLQYQAHFEMIGEFSSQGITSISGFKMGGYYYIAIGGNESKILRYHRGSFVPQTILHKNFGFVELFYPIPARTYRDDMILIVQHRIDFNSHSVSVLEALIWDGESFESSPQIPCRIGNEIYHFGVSCMIDLKRPQGIFGAAILESGQNISIIVPREKAPSGIFQIHTKLSERNTEIEDLEKLYEHLQNMANEQTEIINGARKYLENLKNNSMKLNLEYFSTSELYFNGDIDKIFFNDYQWTENDTKIDMELLMNEIEEIGELLNSTEFNYKIDATALLDDITFSSKNKREIDYDEIELDDVFVDNLMVEKLNGISFEDYVYIKDKQLNFNGTIVFENDVIVENEPDIEIDKSIVGKSNDGVLETDSLVIGGHLEFDSINEILWNDFLKSVVLTNFPNQIDTLEVEGDVLINGDLEIQHLNEFNFPDDLLWSSGPKTSIISAEKTFVRNLTTNAIDTDGGLINGVNPFDFINLSDDQHIPGHTIFKQLEISERLELNGSVFGSGINDYLSNPNLLQTNLIHSACEFNKLIVNGPIKILGKFNSENLDSYLSDVVYKTDDFVTISSEKEFENIEIDNEIDIVSNSISEISLDDFLTTDTDQELEISKINGNIFIDKLYIGGLINSINVTELNKNSLKINEDFNSNMVLIFEEPNGLKVKNLIVDETFNNISVSDFVSVYDDFHLNDAEFDSIEVDNMITNCNITGSNILNGFNLEYSKIDSTFNTSNRESQDNLEINDIYVEHLKTDLINGLKPELILSYLEKINHIAEMIKSGQVHVENITINGDIFVNTINGYNFQKMQTNAIWLNRPNIIKNHLIFNDTIVTDNLKINGKLNQHNFKSFLNDIIFKNENIVLSGYKKFSESIYVNGNSKIDVINSIPFSKIALKTSNLDIPGSLHIIGNLNVKNLEIKESINDFDIKDLHNKFYYNESLKSYVLGGEVNFNGIKKINNLQIDGNLNDIKNLPNFFYNLVYKSKPTIITGKKIFKNSVNFSNGLHIENFNSINLAEFIENIVYIHEPEEVNVHGPVIFSGSIQTGFVEIEDSLHTSNLDGCSVYEWQMNSIRTDLPINFEVLHFGPGVLDGNSLNIALINDHYLSQLITLHTPQNFSGHMKFSEVYLKDSIISYGPINDGVNLNEESENTLMNYGDQHIYTATTMNSFRVVSNLIINPLVNDKNLSNCVTLYGDIEFYSPISFNNLTVQNLYCNDKISGINFEDWYHKSLWLDGKDKQIITGNWTIKNLTTENRIYGNGLIKEFSLDDVKSQLNGPSPELHRNLQELTYEYHSKCELVEELIEKSQNRIYFVKYFKESIKLMENDLIHNINFFKHTNGDLFMLSNIHCNSKIYHWDKNLYNFNIIIEFESGIVNQLISIPRKDDSVNIIINSLDNSHHDCKINGGNVWNFNLQYNLEYLANVNQFGEFSMIHYVPDNYDQFYGIDEKNNLVIEVPVNNLNESKSWYLPADVHGSYRFLPMDAELGIALSDGKRILVVNSNSDKRFSRKINKSDFEADTLLDSKQNSTFTDIKEIVNSIIHKINEEIKYLNNSDPVHSSICENSANIEHIIEEIKKSNKSLTKYISLVKESKGNEAIVDNVTLIASKSIFILWTGLKEIEEFNDNYISYKTENETWKITQEKVKDILNMGIFYIGELAFNTTMKNNTKQKLLIKKLKNINSYLSIWNIGQNQNVNESVNFKDNRTLDSFKNEFKNILDDLIIHISNESKSIDDIPDHILSYHNNHISEIKSILYEIYAQKIILQSKDSSNYSSIANITEHDPLIHISSRMIFFLWNGLKEIQEMFDYFECGKDIYHTYKGSYKGSNFNKIVTLNEAVIITSNTVQLLGNSIIDIADTNFKISTENEERINLLKQKFHLIETQLSKTLRMFDEIIFPNINCTHIDVKLLSTNLKLNITLLDFKEDLKEILEEILIHISDQLHKFHNSKDHHVYDDHEHHLSEINSIIKEIHKQKILPLGLDKIDLKKYHFNEPINSTNLDRNLIIASKTIFYLWNSLKESEEILDYFVNGMEFYRKYIYDTINESEKNKTFIAPLALTTRIIRILGVGIIDIADLTFKMKMEKNQLKISLEQRLKIIYNQLENNLKLLNTLFTCILKHTINSEKTLGKGEQLNSTYRNLYSDSKSEPFYVNLTSMLHQINGDFDIFDEPLIAEALPERNLLTTNNPYFPSKNSGEILALKVGFKNYQRTLIAVTESKEFNRKYDAIRIYYDIMQGHLYQTIPTFKANHLTALNIRDETLLAFVENKNLVKIFNYKGIEGFVKIAKFKTKSPIKLLTSISLSYEEKDKNFNQCPKYYFVAVVENNIHFYEAIMSGFCGVDSIINCKNLG